MLDKILQEIRQELNHDALENIDTDPGVPLAYSGDYKRRVFSGNHHLQLKDSNNKSGVGSDNDTYMKTSESIMHSVSLFLLFTCFFSILHFWHAGLHYCRLTLWVASIPKNYDNIQ